MQTNDQEKEMKILKLDEEPAQNPKSEKSIEIIGK